MRPPKETTNSEVQKAWWSCPGLVYFFGAGEPLVAIKIGVAAITRSGTVRQAILRRLRQIQSSNHELVRVLGLIYLTEGQFPTRSAEVIERDLHIRFSHLQRFKAHYCGAEWFSAGQDLLEYIRENAQPPGKFDVPLSVGLRPGT